MLNNLLQRPRRLRQHALLRHMIAETTLLPRQMMLPYFVIAGSQQREPIVSMPGIERLSIDMLVEQVGRDMQDGVSQILLFGVAHTDAKDTDGRAAILADGLIPSAVRALKQRFGSDICIATDVCLCAYTNHGHCGILDAHGVITNDASVEQIANMALVHAQAGADIVAPSDMMDGRVGAIRALLDAHGYSNTVLMSYSVKYASAYYGPFRHAADCAPGSGDRKTYQMDYRNKRDALRQIALDEQQGADMLMVKPALAYLDMIANVKAATTLPVACYNVSGEYAMIKAAAVQGYIDEASVVRENLYAMRRAGADIIISYHVRDVLRNNWLF